MWKGKMIGHIGAEHARLIHRWVNYSEYKVLNYYYSMYYCTIMCCHCIFVIYLIYFCFYRSLRLHCLIGHHGAEELEETRFRWKSNFYPHLKKTWYISVFIFAANIIFWTESLNWIKSAISSTQFILCTQLVSDIYHSFIN